MSELELAKRFAKDCAYNIAQTHALIAIAEELKRANEARAAQKAIDALTNLLCP
ncbi:hypothetical protein [Mycobacterium intracellulare]|uniref:Uncharacterized protein n=1 Tax=Mycobacterium intracellulare TaxID=1767 RepID=A0AAE4R860_MYCIT|nr:hypothetical protein [Mycobacterium intracellulare]MDV6975272.1 hypothetical protein [Mycobacterium intracellulare]MDV6980336.1 hypothetical protein [Mycobacterium intracellulare]MDV7010765.1 hypothetical protein [Mycobacterium intracellulare]MDV7025671.1 hypothetical protein [Mycobacterium intracellulare]